MLMVDVEAEMPLTSNTAPRKNKYRRSAVKCFGVDLTPDNIAVAMVYFVQGVLGLSRLAVSFYLKDDLHLDPAEVGFVSYLFLFSLMGVAYLLYFTFYFVRSLSHQTTYLVLKNKKKNELVW